MTSRCGLPLRGEVDYSDHVRPSQDFCRSFDRGSLFEHRGTFERVAAAQSTGIGANISLSGSSRRASSKSPR